MSAHLLRVALGVYHDLPIILGIDALVLGSIWFINKMVPPRRRRRR